MTTALMRLSVAASRSEVQISRTVGEAGVWIKGISIDTGGASGTSPESERTSAELAETVGCLLAKILPIAKTQTTATRIVTIPPTSTPKRNLPINVANFSQWKRSKLQIRLVPNSVAGELCGG